MLQAVKTLVNSDVDKIIGNHSLKIKGAVHEFIYWDTCICRVNHEDRTYFLDNGGYNTSSTNRAIAGYKYHFSCLGYKNISENEKYK